MGASSVAVVLHARALCVSPFFGVLHYYRTFFANLAWVLGLMGLGS